MKKSIEVWQVTRLGWNDTKNRRIFTGARADILELHAEVERLRRDCAEAYQVMGTVLLSDCPHTDADDVRALDNLSAAANGHPRPHDDLLPWPLAVDFDEVLVVLPWPREEV